MEMPKPSAEIQTLSELFQGTWRGSETLHPSPWDPAGGPGFGTWVVHPSLDGFYLLVDYTEERGGKVVYRGHGVHGWEAREGRYLEYWFDNIGVTPRSPNVATLEGNVYRYFSESPGGTNRFTYVFEGDTLRFSIEVAAADGGWKPMHEGAYTRA